MKWTEAHVLDAIREAYLPPPAAPGAQQAMDEWAMLTQVPLRCLTPAGEAAAAGREEYGRHINERTIDAFLVRCWSGGKGFERIAYEVKVSRPDYRNETDEKRAPAEASAHLCAYATPAGLLDPAELPPGWGLLEVYETTHERTLAGIKSPLGSRLAWRKRPTKRTPTCDLDYLVTAGFRRASRAEESIRNGNVPAAEYARMQKEVASLRGIADTAQRTARREMARAKLARSELLSLDGATECADCDEAVTWKRGGPLDSRWTHDNPLHEAPCVKARTEADRLAKEREFGASYAWGMPGQVEPRVIREARKAADLEDAQEAAL